MNFFVNLVGNLVCALRVLDTHNTRLASFVQWQYAYAWLLLSANGSDSCNTLVSKLPIQYFRESWLEDDRTTVLNH